MNKSKLILFFGMALAVLVLTIAYYMRPWQHKKTITTLLTHDSCKYWLDASAHFQHTGVGVAFCVGDTLVYYYKRKDGSREMTYSPTNWLIGDIGLLCKWKYVGDSIVEEASGTWKIVRITQDTLIRKWEKWGTDTLIHDK